MVRYRIRDRILSEILGKDYYLPEDRNYAVDIEGGWHVHMENAQASKLVAVVEDEKGNIVFERELPVRNGRLIVDIYRGDYGVEGALTGLGVGGLVALIVGLTTRDVRSSIIPILTTLMGFGVGKTVKAWKVRRYA